MYRAEREGYELRPCKRCDDPIIFAERTDKPGAIPLDPKAPVFVVTVDEDGKAYARQVKRMEDTLDSLYVSHFSTCRDLTKAHRLVIAMRKVLLRVQRDGDTSQVDHCIDEANSYLGLGGKS